MSLTAKRTISSRILAHNIGAFDVEYFNLNPGSKQLVITSDDEFSKYSSQKIGFYLQKNRFIPIFYTIPKTSFPQQNIVTNGIELAKRAGITSIISLGSNSTIDVSKAIKKSLEYDIHSSSGNISGNNVSYPLVLIPTTVSCYPMTSCYYSLHETDDLLIQNTCPPAELICFDSVFLSESPSYIKGISSNYLLLTLFDTLFSYYANINPIITPTATTNNMSHHLGGQNSSELTSLLFEIQLSEQSKQSLSEAHFLTLGVRLKDTNITFGMLFQALLSQLAVSPLPIELAIQLSVVISMLRWSLQQLKKQSSLTISKPLPNSKLSTTTTITTNNKWSERRSLESEVESVLGEIEPLKTALLLLAPHSTTFGYFSWRACLSYSIALELYVTHAPLNLRTDHDCDRPPLINQFTCPYENIAAQSWQSLSKLVGLSLTDLQSIAQRERLLLLQSKKISERFPLHRDSNALGLVESLAFIEEEEIEKHPTKTKNNEKKLELLRSDYFTKLIETL